MWRRRIYQIYQMCHILRRMPPARVPRVEPRSLSAKADLKSRPARPSRSERHCDPMCGLPSRIRGSRGCWKVAAIMPRALSVQRRYPRNRLDIQIFPENQAVRCSGIPEMSLNRIPNTISWRCTVSEVPGVHFKGRWLIPVQIAATGVGYIPRSYCPWLALRPLVIGGFHPPDLPAKEHQFCIRSDECGRRNTGYWIQRIRRCGEGRGRGRNAGFPVKEEETEQVESIEVEIDPTAFPIARCHYRRLWASLW